MNLSKEFDRLTTDSSEGESILSILKEKLVRVDSRAQHVSLGWGNGNHCASRDKKEIKISKEETHNNDTFTYIAIYILAYCLSQDSEGSHQEIANLLVKKAMLFRVLNLDNVTCDASCHREYITSS